MVEHDVGPPKDLTDQDLGKDFLAAAAAAGLGYGHSAVPRPGREEQWSENIHHQKCWKFLYIRSKSGVTLQLASWVVVLSELLVPFLSTLVINYLII